MTKLSENFNLEEFYNPAEMDGRPLPAEIEANIRFIVDKGLQPIRTKWGRPLKVNSCYRDPIHNEKIGGSKTSAHLKALAVDIDASSDSFNDELGALIINMVKAGEIECDQLIFEDFTAPDGFKWIHYGIRKDHISNVPRKMYMIAVAPKPFKYEPLTPEMAKKFSIEL